MRKQKWTTDDMPNQKGKAVIITGGNSGLGYESVKAFALKGAEVILACRSLERGEEAKAAIMNKNPTGNIVVMLLDLMDLSSIKNFAAKFKEEYSRLDILMNNAGIMMNPYGLTKDGFESQIGTNHLGHFALTGLLIDVIVKTPLSRVINVSSLAHKQWKMDFDNFFFENGKGYNSMKAYSQSKLANLLFTYHLQNFFENKNIQSIAVAAHPGASHTNLGRFLEDKLLIKLFRPLIENVLPSSASGALPQIRAAVDPDVKGGEYYGPSGLFQLSGSPVLVKSNKASHNRGDAKKLWEVSEKLTGVKYEFV